MNEYSIPYHYTTHGYAVVIAESLEQAFDMIYEGSEEVEWNTHNDDLEAMDNVVFDRTNITITEVD